MSNISDLTKSFSKEFSTSIRTSDQIPDIEVIPTGLPSFDLFIQDCGGFPRGRVIEAYGGESSCKSTFGHFLSACGTRFDPKFTTLWLDVEGCYVKSWAEQMGQNIKRTIVPDDLYWAEDYLHAIKWAIVNNIDMVVLDCVVALVAKSVGERHLNKGKDGKILKKQDEGIKEERDLKMNEKLARAAFLSQVLMPDLMAGFTWGNEKHRLKNSRTFIYFINQIRTKPNAYGYANYDDTPGGQALKHLYSARWYFKRLGKSAETDENGDPTHQIIQIENVKNKLGTPFRSAQFMLDLKGGFKELEESFFDIADAKGLINQVKQGTYVINGETFRGKAKVISYIKEHSELLEGSFVEDTTLDVLINDKQEVKQMSEKVRRVFNSDK